MRPNSEIPPWTLADLLGRDSEVHRGESRQRLMTECRRESDRPRRSEHDSQPDANERVHGRPGRNPQFRFVPISHIMSSHRQAGHGGNPSPVVPCFQCCSVANRELKSRFLPRRSRCRCRVTHPAARRLRRR